MYQTSCRPGTIRSGAACVPVRNYGAYDAKIGACIYEGMVVVSTLPYTFDGKLESTDEWTKWSQPDGYACNGDDGMNTKLADVCYIPATDTDRIIAVTTCGSDLETALIMHTGDINNPTYLTCDNDGATDYLCGGPGTSSGDSALAFTAEANVAYYLAVRHDGIDFGTGPYILNIDANPVIDRQPVPVDLGPDTISTSLELTDLWTKLAQPAGWACGYTNVQLADVYSISATDTDRNIDVNTCGGDLDTTLIVYEDTGDISSPTYVACNKFGATMAMCEQQKGRSASNNKMMRVLHDDDEFLQSTLYDESFTIHFWRSHVRFQSSSGT
ncbi:hypothetical protein FOA52_002231 [Chlamydomonas sp. UWO 241]|nr:hypothetical protein FOA52_002231 [Chlamydomonas sp. UWO 241]